jgi:hypothetical protein
MASTFSIILPFDLILRLFGMASSLELQFRKSTYIDFSELFKLIADLF